MIQAGARRIEPRDIEDEMRSSYIDYAMSVIVGRALPDVRDGLKPVHRRILYAMYDMGMLPGRPYKKCARIVGEVLGKYHPHGDMAVYDALVRMAQDFSVRYELVDGYGNFGSVDGDNPAAMRYTEARLSKLAMELLRDIDKETVNFVPNFDDTLQEPSVLPARFPNLLVNGSSGIAVGMATNVPPHNLAETIDAAVMLIDNPEATVKDLMQAIKGPDFPTGGIIMGRSGIKDAYTTGRGAIKVRGRAHIEQTKTGKTRIIVDELPFQVNKARLAEKIAELVREKKLTEISDLRDESDRSGMRFLIELKREAIPQVVLNKLYKLTQLEISFGVIMLALVDGVPRTMNLAEVLKHYIEHQKEVVVRRTKYELAKAEARAHVLEGLLIALRNLDAVIKTIRGSKTVEIARQRLMEQFKLTEIQAQAILDMRLQKLTGLERQKIEQEHKDLLEQIAYLKNVLADEKLVFGLVKEELLEIKQRFGDARRTQIAVADVELDVEDLIAEEDMVITITHSGYIKRLPVATYRQQGRGGRGIAGMGLKEGDFVEHLFIASTHDYLLFFTNNGRCYWLKVYEIPEMQRAARGRALANILSMHEGEALTKVMAVDKFDETRYVFFATAKGTVKKTPLEAYSRPRADGIIAINLDEGDTLVGVDLTSGQDQIVLATREGQAVRFEESDVRPMGRGATGVRGVNLVDDDVVVDMAVARPGQDLLTVCEGGFGKKTPIEEYRLTRRGGKGVINIKATDRNGKVVALKSVTDTDDLMFISAKGIVLRTESTSMREIGRATQGVRLIRLEEGDKVVAVARIISEDDEQKPSEAEAPTAPAEPETAAGTAQEPPADAGAETDSNATPSDADTYDDTPAEDEPQDDSPPAKGDGE